MTLAPSRSVRSNTRAWNAPCPNVSSGSQVTTLMTRTPSGFHDGAEDARRSATTVDLTAPSGPRRGRRPGRRRRHDGVHGCGDAAAWAAGERRAGAGARTDSRRSPPVVANPGGDELRGHGRDRRDRRSGLRAARAPALATAPGGARLLRRRAGSGRGDRTSSRSGAAAMALDRDGARAERRAPRRLRRCHRRRVRNSATPVSRATDPRNPHEAWYAAKQWAVAPVRDRGRPTTRKELCP